MESASKRDRSRRGELQRLLGERGEVLPRIAHGTPNRPAQGWYARIGEEEVFLGDYSSIAVVTIARMLESVTQ
ncbi:MAG TPA: hypothetical protein VNY31_10440 [Solirubrobacteraceae bacterium]|jgi:hypothetical protein|nr:hypothetical protein [Solirubrobacteraceae bacterium]